MEDQTTRICFICKDEKPLNAEHFYKDYSKNRVFQRECKSCNKTRKAQWWKSAEGKRSSANTKLKARFGISLEQYEILLKKSGFKCAICGAGESTNGHRLAIDHSHVTGKVRGILCKSCNLGIGHLKDSIPLLFQAADYLERCNQ